tara:strand:- start:2666 stop:2887 length:222 start_codon:yes stop_codon:yes gene_type:complete
MAYKSYGLKDVYNYLMEGDQEALNTSRLLSLDSSELGDYLAKLKRANPKAYGSALVKLYSKPQSRELLLNTIS